MMFSWFRRRPRNVAPLKRGRGGLKPQLEALEDRRLLAIGSPVWIAEGPTAINQANTNEIAGNGAVQSVVIDPTDPGKAFAATVDGGVWRTTNLTDASPNWSPVTDQVTGLAKPFPGMTDIALSPLDPSHNTLYASTGRFATSLHQPGPPVGVYKTVNGGNTWENLGATVLGGLTITNMVPTALTGPQGDIVFVSTTLSDPAGYETGDVPYSTGKTSGIYRSGDGGQNWQLISGSNGLPAGNVYQLVVDSSNPNRLYAALPGQGIFISNTGGADWQPVAGNSQLVGIAQSSGFRLTIHNTPGNNVLYVAVVANGFPSGIYRSVDQGGNFTPMSRPGDPVKSVNPGGQAPLNLSLTADPTSPSVVWIGGDVGGIYRGDASLPAASQWTKVTGPGANNTEPHPDSRNIVFQSNGDLVETDDGGVWRLTTPNDAANRRWNYIGGSLPIGGALAVTAVEYVAYDPVNHIIFGGAQDNGTPQQNAADSPLYSEVSSGDGQFALSDSTLMPGFSIRYTSAQEAHIYRTTYNGSNVPTNGLPRTDANLVALKVENTDKNLEGIEKLDHTIAMAVNAVDGKRFLIGTTTLYESMNRGDTLVALGGLDAENKPKTRIGTVKAIAYGGRLNGQDAPRVAFVGTDGDAQANDLFFRGPEDNSVFAALTTYHGSTPLQIALDPDNWKTGYILDLNNRIWRMTNGGAAEGDFTEITGNFATGLGITSAGRLRGLAIFPNTSAPDDEVVFVSGYGGVAATDNATLGGGATWTAFGTGLPTSTVSALTYDPSDNVLVAATFGRGFYIVKDLSNFVGHTAPVVKLGAPASAGNDFATTFTAGGGGVAIADPGAAITAGSSPTLTRMTITIANPFDGNDESLSADVTGANITVSDYNPASGQLILSGTDTVAHYQMVLGTVRFNDTAAPITGNARKITVRVNDGAAAARAVTTLTMEGAVNAPTISSTDDTSSAGSKQPTRVHSAAVIVKDADSAALAGATVTILNLLDAPNEILAAVTTGTNIAASFNPYTGILTLTGSDTVAHYQQVLDSVTYTNLAEVPDVTLRRISFTVSDGALQSLADVVMMESEPVNHAPVLNPAASFTMNPVIKDDPNPPGTSVSDLLDSAVPGDAFSDLDEKNSRGIAVVGVDKSHGVWQFSEDDGQTWEEIDQVSTTRAILLPENDEILIRFVPSPGFSGTIAAGLSFRAWDQTSELPGEFEPDLVGSIADTTENGGDSPFSVGIASASITVNLAPNERFVQALYQDFLNRIATSAEVNDWLALLPTVGRGGLANGIARSQEAFMRIVDRLYVQFLGRPASDAGSQTWLTMLENGETIETVSDGILASPEFAQHANALIGGANANENLIRAYYQVVLIRAASQSEVDFWLPAASSSRFDVANAFVDSDEFRSLAVRTMYDVSAARPIPFVPNLLGRSGTTAESEIQGWSTSSFDILTIETQLASSSEYFNG